MEIPSTEALICESSLNGTKEKDQMPLFPTHFFIPIPKFPKFILSNVIKFYIDIFLFKSFEAKTCT